MAAPKKPKGAKSDKEWRDMIRLAVNELRADPKSGKKTKALRQLAGKLVEKALQGDIAALKEIGDRLDGRPAQAVELGGKDGKDLSFTITFVKPDGGYVVCPISGEADNASYSVVGVAGDAATSRCTGFYAVVGFF